MRSVKDWRSPSTAADFEDLDNADFAQEFLRRNPIYCSEYHELTRRIAADKLDGPAELQAFAQQWGLSFPVRPGPCARPGPCDLGAGACNHYGRPRRRAS